MRYIASLKKKIEQYDVNAAKNLLDQFTGETDETKLKVINELAIAPDDIAWELLYYLALEIKIYDKDMYEHIIQLIMDRAHLNFKFAIILYKTGKIKRIKGGVPLMRHILSNSTDLHIISETIETAGKEKIESLLDDIAEYIYYDNAELKDKAVEALGRIGTEAAVFRLKQACTTKKCDINILNTIVLLKSQGKPSANEFDSSNQSISRLKKNIDQKKTDTRKKSHNRKTIKNSKKTENLETGIIKQHAVTKNKDALIEQNTEKAITIPKSNNFISLYQKLQSKKPDTRLAAFNSISEMTEADRKYLIVEALKSDNYDLKILILKFLARAIPENSLPDIYALFDHKTIDPKIEFAALEALFAFPELHSAAAVIDRIESPSMFIRMAAAKVLDKNSTDFVCAEIKDRIESGKRRGEIIVQAILAAKAENIINCLMISDTFSYIVSNCFSEATPESYLKTYIEVLYKRGLKSTAKKFETVYRKKNNTAKPSAMVISSSSCVQDVYENLLFLKGYTYVGYKSCQDAFEALSSSKPDLVICDLFLHTMTGFNFAKEIREFYPKDILTFIISSMQRGLNNNTLKEECINSGVNAVMEFPVMIPDPNLHGAPNK